MYASFFQCQTHAQNDLLQVGTHHGLSKIYLTGFVVPAKFARHVKNTVCLYESSSAGLDAIEPMGISAQRDVVRPHVALGNQRCVRELHGGAS